MIIGNTYSDKKIYRGIQHEHKKPLLSKDLHEEFDTISMKDMYFMKGVLGSVSGTLTNPGLSISSKNVNLQEPIVVSVEGDIVLAHTSLGTPLFTTDDISKVPIGYVCIVGWYQLMTSDSTLREYGGLDNQILENDLKDNELNQQVSTRYQFVWQKAIINKTDFDSSNTINISVPARYLSGERYKSGGRDVFRSISTYKEGNIRKSDVLPQLADVGLVDTRKAGVYVIPIISYEYDGTSQSFTTLKTIRSLKPRGSEIIKSGTKPLDSEEGTLWYNPDNSNLYLNVEGVGFISTTPKYVVRKYTYEHTITEGNTHAPYIGLSTKEYDDTSDKLDVYYEGLLLVEGRQYRDDVRDAGNIHLLFPVKEGEIVTMVVTKIEEKFPLIV